MSGNPQLILKGEFIFQIGNLVTKQKVITILIEKIAPTIKR
jgi:hypothetical protein